jgi:hypothetical protein
MMEEILKIMSDGKIRNIGEIAEQTGCDYNFVASMVEYLQQRGIVPVIDDNTSDHGCKSCISCGHCKH